MESLEPSKSLVDQAYQVILDALCDGTFKAGDRLTQEDIAARLNVSRQPVTHALAILKAQGFLMPSGRRGLIVTSVDPKFFEDIYRFRQAIEALAIQLATPRLTQQAIVRGRSLIAHGHNMVAASDKLASLQADMDFHAFIYDLSGNQIIEETMHLHWQHLRRAMGQVYSYPGMSIRVWQDHGRILESMVRGETDAAIKIMDQHLGEACERVRSQEREAEKVG